MNKSQFEVWFEAASGARLLGFVVALTAVLALVVGSLPSPSTGGIGSRRGIPGSVADALAAGEAGGDQAFDAAGAGGSGGQESGAGGAGSSGVAAGGASGTGRLNKSDQGVDETSIRMGFLTVNLRGLEVTGYAPPLRSDINAVIDAYVDEVNKAGGINGRRIQPEKRAVDPTSLENQMEICQVMTRDLKVFSVVTTVTNIRKESQECYLYLNPTAYTHSYPMSQEFQAGSGLDLSANRNLTRIAKEWIHAAKTDPLGSRPPDTGPFLKGGEVVGVLTENCEPSISQVIKKVLIPALEAPPSKPSRIELLTTACDPGVQQAEAGQAATVMASRGVTHVLLALNYISVEAFHKTADADPTRKFKYYASDYNGVSADFFTRHWSKDQWDRVRGITVTYSGYKAAGNPTTAEEKRCSDILKRHGLPGFFEPGTNPDSHAEAAGMCDEFDIMVAAARAAGPNLTRSTWSNAGQRLGKVPTQGIPSVTFAPGKFSGGDTVASIEWHGECTCYQQISGYRNAQF